MSNAELKRTAFDPTPSRRSELIDIVAGGFEFAANSKPLLEYRSARLKDLIAKGAPKGGYLTLNLDGAIFFHVLRFLQHGVFPRLTLKDNPQKLDLVAYQILERQAAGLELETLRDGAVEVVACFEDYFTDLDGKLRELQMSIYMKSNKRI